MMEAVPNSQHCTLKMCSIHTLGNVLLEIKSLAPHSIFQEINIRLNACGDKGIASLLHIITLERTDHRKTTLEICCSKSCKSRTI